MCLVPVLTSKYLKIDKIDTAKKGEGKFGEIMYAVNSAFNNFFAKLDENYARGVSFVLHHRKQTILTLVAALILSFASIAIIGFIFMPESAANSVEVEFTLPQGTKLEITDDTMHEFENLAKQELTGVKYTTMLVGGTSTFSSGAETNTGKITFSLYEPSNRLPGYDNELSAKEKLRKHFNDFPGVDLKFAANANGASARSDIDIMVKSDDLNLVREYAALVEKMLKEKGADLVQEVTSDQEEGLPEATIIVNREKMYEFGLNIHSVGAEIQGAINGTTASRYTEKGKDIDVVVKLAEHDKKRLDDLDSISVVNSSGQRIPLSSFARYEETTAPVTIYRENQARIVHVTAKRFNGMSLGVCQKGVRQLLADNIPKEDGVIVQLGGSMEDVMEAVTNFGMIIIMAAFLVFVVMASQFESLLDPFIVTLTIPFSFIGVIMIYGLTGTQLNVVTIMGMLVLVGTIVNNGIVLVDYTNLLRKRGMELEEACVEAARNRLRPILMSTLTTVISLAPMAFFPGEGSQSMQPISLTVFGGMTFGSMMTLFVMPTIYFIFNNRRIRKAERKKLKKLA